MDSKPVLVSEILAAEIQEAGGDGLGVPGQRMRLRGAPGDAGGFRAALLLIFKVAQKVFWGLVAALLYVDLYYIVRHWIECVVFWTRAFGNLLKTLLLGGLEYLLSR